MARDLASSAVRKSNAAYRQHATPADAGLPEHVSLALLDPWDGAAMGALTDGLEVDVLLRLGLGFGLGLGLGLRSTIALPMSSFLASASWPMNLVRVRARVRVRVRVRGERLACAGRPPPLGCGSAPR